MRCAGVLFYGIRYAMVGLSVAAFYLLVSWALLRAMPNDRIIALVTSFVLATLFQYVLQATATFRRPLANSLQIFRFGTTVLFGLLISIVLMAYIVPLLEAPDWLGLIMVVVLLPFVNFFIMFVWVFGRAQSPDLSTTQRRPSTEAGGA